MDRNTALAGVAIAAAGAYALRDDFVGNTQASSSSTSGSGGSTSTGSSGSTSSGLQGGDSASTSQPDPTLSVHSDGLTGPSGGETTADPRIVDWSIPDTINLIATEGVSTAIRATNVSMSFDIDPYKSGGSWPGGYDTNVQVYLEREGAQERFTFFDYDSWPWYSGAYSIPDPSEIQDSYTVSPRRLGSSYSDTIVGWYDGPNDRDGITTPGPATLSVRYGNSTLFSAPVQLTGGIPTIDDVEVGSVSIAKSGSTYTVQSPVKNPVPHGVNVTLELRAINQDTGSVDVRRTKQLTASGVISAGDRANVEDVSWSIDESALSGSNYEIDVDVVSRASG